MKPCIIEKQYRLFTNEEVKRLEEMGLIIIRYRHYLGGKILGWVSALLLLGTLLGLIGGSILAGYINKSSYNYCVPGAPVSARPCVIPKGSLLPTPSSQR